MPKEEKYKVLCQTGGEIDIDSPNQYVRASRGGSPQGIME